MCGLAGSFTQTNTDLTDKQRLRRARVLEGLLIANASRGTDATGIATICGDDRCIYKRAKPSYQFVDSKDARKHLRTNAPLILGHTRYGTHGTNNDENAHPFEEGSVIGTHNGVISNYTSLDAALREAKKIDTKDYAYSKVDSQAVFRLLDHAGPGGYIDALAKVRGSAALVWHDKRNTEGLWMVRHSNPINLAWVPSMDTLFWSSQYDHLSSVLWGAFGDNWYSVATKEDVLYLFNRKNILDFEQWAVKFDDVITQYSTSYARYGHGGTQDEWDEYWNAREGIAAWDDPDDDGDVEHPYAVATVTATPFVGKDEGKGKARSASVAGAGKESSNSVSPLTTTSGTSLSGVENVVSVLNRMGVPFDSIDANDSPTITSVEDGDGNSILAPFDDPNCTVCMQPLEEVEMGRYFQNTGEWICSPCLTYWENDSPGLLEAMGHA